MPTLAIKCAALLHDRANVDNTERKHGLVGLLFTCFLCTRVRVRGDLHFREAALGDWWPDNGKARI